MSYPKPIRVPSSGNPWIDGLTDGYRWGTTKDNPAVGYTFISDTSDQPKGEFGGYPSWGWSDQERELMVGAMESIAKVSGLEFSDRGDDNDDDVEIWFYNMDGKSSEGSYGFAYTPGSDSDEGLVAINWSAYQNHDGSFKHSIAPGSFYGITFLHELSHAVGLKHPHDKGLRGQPRFPGLKASSDQYRDAGDYGQNAHPWTQLSYVDKKARNGLVPEKIEDYGFLQKPGALDVAALQWLYGINEEAAGNDNVYRLPLENEEGTGWESIWDTGGIDRIDGSRSKKPVRIDLRNATLDQSDSAGGYVSRVKGVFGGFTIAHDWDGKMLESTSGGCVIENATGGKKGDVLIGNAANNTLKGGKGRDILFAGSGRKNRSIGGNGDDEFWIDAEPGSFVEIMDFQKGDDQLVFDQVVDRENVDLRAHSKHTKIYVEDAQVGLLKNAQIDEQSLLFLDFSATIDPSSEF